MANSIDKVRTNYIRFTDTATFAAFEQIVSKACVNEDDHLEIHTKPTDDGEIYAMFCAHSCILGYSDNSEDPDYDYDAFIYDLQTIIPDGEALLIYGVGFEKLRYLYGECDIVTNKEWKHVSLENAALDTAKLLLNDPDWTTQSSY